MGDAGGEVVRELGGLVEVSLAGRGGLLEEEEEEVRDGNGEEMWCILVFGLDIGLTMFVDVCRRASLHSTGLNNRH